MTGLSISEALALQWADVEYAWNRIMVRRSWVNEIGNCKNANRKAPVAMHPALADHLGQWHAKTMYARPTDWVLALSKLKGAKPRCGNIASQAYLHPAALKAGILQSVEGGTGTESLSPVTSTWLAIRSFVGVGTICGTVSHPG